MKLISSKDGISIACWQSGIGQPLVLVHGTSGDHGSWNPLLPFLEPHFSVYNLDRRGRGQSADAESYAIAREAEDVAAVIDAIGGQVIVLGHSFGGLCALEAALLTDNIAQLMLYEPPLSLTGTVWSEDLDAQMQTFLDNGQPEEVWRIFYRDMLKTPASEIAMMQNSPSWSERVAEAHTIHRELKHIGRYQFQAERFSSLTLPVTLFLGSHSPMRRKTTAQTLNQALSNSRIELLEKQGHSAIRNAPELFAQKVRENLSGL